MLITMSSQKGQFLTHIVEQFTFVHSQIWCNLYMPTTLTYLSGSLICIATTNREQPFLLVPIHVVSPREQLAHIFTGTSCQGIPPHKLQTFSRIIMPPPEQFQLISTYHILSMMRTNSDPLCMSQCWDDSLVGSSCGFFISTTMSRIARPTKWK
jgi:hypothetical protein